MTKGLFVGLTTVDLIYLTDHFPAPNEKMVALDQMIVAGGPATNAAVTFAGLGSQAQLLSVVGTHPLATMIKSDLAAHRVELIDLNSQLLHSPPASSIIVTQGTGSRAVVSLNATKIPATVDQIPNNILQDVDIVLVDGHQIAVAVAIARAAHSANIPVVLDGGSWKPGLDALLPYVSYAICSANFYPPSCQSASEVFGYFTEFSLPFIAITAGKKPIQYQANSQLNSISIPTVDIVDSLGAGDVFHGAFCHYIVQLSFVDALATAAKIASYSCRFFGTREFLANLSTES